MTLVCMSHKNYADQTWFGYKKYLNHFQTKFPNEIEIRQNKQNFNFWENTNHSNHKWIVTVYCAVANVGTFESKVLTPWWDGLDFSPEEEGDANMNLINDKLSYYLYYFYILYVTYTVSTTFQLYLFKFYNYFRK